MLRKKIIKKIYLTTLIFFIILLLSTFTDYNKIANIKSEYQNDLVGIYLIDSDNYLNEVMVLVNNKNDYGVIYEIVDKLKNTNQYFEGLKGIIPSSVKINKININDKILAIDFNQSLLEVAPNLEEKVLESLIYSITNLDYIDGLKISIDGKDLKELPQSKYPLKRILTREFGINKEYAINRTNNIEKLFLYYYKQINSNEYLVPITKYVNSNQDKVKIIIDNLRNSYLTHTNLMSYLNERITLLTYEETNNIITLSFANLITLNPNNALEEVIYTIANSLFDSTNIDKIIFLEKDHIITIKERN